MTTPSQHPQAAHGKDGTSGLPVTPLCDAIDCFTREEYTRKVYDLLELARKLERKTVDQQAELLALRADKARLDWLEDHGTPYELTEDDYDHLSSEQRDELKKAWHYEVLSPLPVREAIDEALNSLTQGAK